MNGAAGGITTYYENAGATLTPSLNTSIRVIAGDYYSNNPSNNVQLTMPTATASNDYMMIEFVVSYPASQAPFAGGLLVTFPSSNTFYQSDAKLVSYFWDCNATYWTVTDFRTSATTYVS
jgi:hypothetical protein